MIAPRSLRWRLAAWMFAATACVAVLLTAYYQRRTHALLSRESDERLATMARYVASTSVLGVIGGNVDLLAAPIEAAMSQPDVEAVALYGADGALMAGRARDPSALLVWRPGSGDCRPCPLGRGRLRWVAPVVSARVLSPASFDDTPSFDGPPPAAAVDAAPAGWLVLDVSNRARFAEERRITASGLLIAGVALVLALVVTLAIAQGLTSPLRALAQATRAIGQGRWDAPLPRAASSEIAQLAADFHAMTAALADLDRENRRYREHLEEMVAHRTRELEEAYGRMKAMAEAKDQFVATVSHDFRSPLAIVLSAVQTVLADPEMRDDVRRQFLGRAERQCKRLGTLVSDLLDLARIENRDAAFERLDLAEVVEESVEGARAACEERRVSLVWAPPADPIVAEVDRGQVSRAIANLVDNALKFTPPGGRVAVDLRGGGGEALVAVSDTGPGIPEDEREHVFERFYQGREGQALGKGSGLGLAIVAGVARRHGGRVEVTSADGAGSRFELRLPVSRG